MRPLEYKPFLNNTLWVISRRSPDGAMVRSASVSLTHLKILSYSKPIISHWQIPDWLWNKQGAEPWGRFYCSTPGAGTNETWVSFQIHALLGQVYSAALLRQCCGMTTPIREVKCSLSALSSDPDSLNKADSVCNTNIVGFSNKPENQDVDVEGKTWTTDL